MRQLEQEMARLRLLFEPWNTAPHGTVIWEPEPSDSNAEFKRSLIAKASQIIGAGDAALSGESFEVPEFAESNFAAISDTLSQDPEERDFVELANACESVTSSLARIHG